MTDSDRPELDGWTAHRIMQLEAALTSSHRQRLEWLEAAIRFAYEAGALPRTDRSEQAATRDP